MKFVELDRSFVPVAKDKEPVFNAEIWGRKYGGWNSWADLLQRRRVVLLAEASSGKSEEFTNQQAALEAAGKIAFFMRIEELADQGFEAALEANSADRFKLWIDSKDEAYFFLDSVDEARLNQKSFETALKRFARDLGKAFDRSRVYVSCRVTDWRGEKDRALMQRILPSWETASTDLVSGSNPLLDPIFNKDARNQVQKNKQPDKKPYVLLVVQIVPLDSRQCALLAKACGVADTPSFMNGIEAAGLDAFTDRPGDVIELATYWITHERFGKLSEMIEYGISHKLAEEDAHRPDNAELSAELLRANVETVAAGLTLQKTFTLRAPGHDPDPSLLSGALDTSKLLTTLTPAQQNALLRRGVFAPATYGRVRFHHRTTQEYLSAAWLGRLLEANCPLEEVWNLIFTERYGVLTTVPSMRPAAAWLSLKRTEILDEIIKREPLVLLRNGDPGSLTLDAKKRLLLSFAKLHAAALVANDGMENRAIALFAEPQLADTIKAAWKLNSRHDFRMDLLRIMREGKITECKSLARTVVQDKTAPDYNRVVALQALSSCSDAIGMKKAAALVMKEKAASAKLKAYFAGILFPAYLSVANLITLIDQNPASKRSSDGFDYAAKDLYAACTDDDTKKKLVSALCDLCLKKPFAESWQRVSKKHVSLAKHLQAIAVSEIGKLAGVGTEDHVVRLLMIIERCDRSYAIEDGPSLRTLVGQNTVLKRALFWADLAEIRANGRDAVQKPTRIWQVFLSGGSFWELGLTDLEWLYSDLHSRLAEDDKRIILSAIVQIHMRENALEAERPKLRAAIAGVPVLEADLAEYLAPPKEDSEFKRHRKRMEALDAKRKQQEEKDKQSWLDFCERLKDDPSLLTNPKYLKDWKSGAFRLYHLAHWLRARTGTEDREDPLQWRLLGEGFSEEVAEAFRDGMKAFWRLTKPERPKRQEGGGITVKNTTIMAYQAVGIEAAENPDWAVALSQQDAKTALGHACLSEQGVPPWLYDLVDAHPKLAIDAIGKAVLSEWGADSSGRSDFLYHFARKEQPLHPAVEPVLVKVLMGEADPEEINKLDTALRIIGRLPFTKTQIVSFVKTIRSRFKKHVKVGKPNYAMRDLASLLILDGDLALNDLSTWLAKAKKAERAGLSESVFAYLFDRHDPIVPNILAKLSVPGLEALLRLAYRYIRPEDDEEHEGSYTPQTRDHAENARNTILGALIETPGADAYYALQRVADDPGYESRRQRFHELARGKAESDSEFPAWTSPEVVAFEKEHMTPAKTGEDLLRIVMGVLCDLQAHLRKGDATSRPLLERAKDEDEVRNYVVEQLIARSRKRFHAYREAQVADKDRPDIIVASTSAPCEVGMEVKHGAKSWTKAQLSDALRTQLAEDYLKPATRRHGIFVISKHGPRRWRDADTKQWITFESMTAWLQEQAKGILMNTSGAIAVRCVGLDATDNRLG
jgi:hypothetical protein